MQKPLEPLTFDIEDYQAALCEALATGKSAERVIARLMVDPRCEGLHDYIASFDLRSVEVLTKLMGVWGLREQDLTKPPTRTRKRPLKTD
jgi:hypothetical protein